MRVCVCVCVCVRELEREGQRHGEVEKQSTTEGTAVAETQKQ